MAGFTIGELINKVGFKVSENDVSKVNSTIQSIKSTATKVLGSIGIGLSLTGLNNILEEFGRINDQIRNSTAGLEDSAEAQNKILEAATLTRTTYEQTARVVSDLVKGNSSLFGTIDEAVAFNNAATMLFKTAGKTNEQVARLMEAINKSFQKGYVDSETLSQLLENAPEAVELLNKELGTTSDQLEQMATDGKFTVAQLKSAFINSAGEIATNFSNVALRISDAITYCKNKFGVWLTSFNEALGITTSFGNIVVTVFNVIMAGLQKAGDGFIWFAKKVGGATNALKLMAIVGASIYTVLKWEKIIANVVATYQAIVKAVNGITPKMLGLIALVVLLYLAIDDFYHFMKGNDSLMGEMLERAGIDCDEFREKITTTFQNVVDFVLPLWQGFADAFAEIGAKFAGFWGKYGDEILAGFGEAISKIGESIYKFVEWITGAKNAEEVMYNIGKSIGYFAASLLALKPAIAVGKGIGGLFSNLWKGYKTLKDIFKAPDKLEMGLSVIGDVSDETADAIKKAADAATKSKGGVLGFISTVFARGKELVAWVKNGKSISSFFNMQVQIILGKAKTIVPGLSGVFTKCIALLEKVKRSGGLGNFLYINFQNLAGKLGVGLKKVFSGNLFKNLFSGLGTKLAGLGPKIVTAIKALFTGIGGAAGSATVPILAIIAAIAALLVVIPLIVKNWDKIKEWTIEKWNAIKDYLATTWENLKAKAGETFENFRAVCAEKIENARAAVVDGFQKAVDWITSLPSKAVKWGADIIDNIVSGIKGKINNVVEAVSGVASTIKDYLGFSEPEEGPLSNFHTYMPDMIDLMVEGINDGEGSVQEAVSELASTFTGLVNNGTESMEALIEVTENGIKKAVTAVQSGFEKMGSSATKKIKELKSKIQQGMNEISNWMERDFVPRGKTWGEDLIENMIIGIGNSLPLLEKTLKGTAKTIQDYVGFSEPDVGPLSDFHTYMPDMIDLMVKGISDGKARVREAMEGLTGEMSVVATAHYVAPTTAMTAVGGNTIIKNIVQHNDFNNQFYGDKAIQRETSNTMKQSAKDVTAELARGLNFT